jgi:hypothetical protein
MSVKAFVAAHTVVEVLKEHGATAAISLLEDGTCTLILTYEDYAKCKTVAEELLGSEKWFTDVYGNFNLFSQNGLKDT